MRSAAALLIVAALLAGCGGQDAAPAQEPVTNGQAAQPPTADPHPEPATSESDQPAPVTTERPIEDIAAEIVQGMACEDALALMPEPLGSFSGEDVTVTGVELPDTDEERITYVWENASGEPLFLTCLDGSVLGVGDDMGSLVEVEGGQ